MDSSLHHLNFLRSWPSVQMLLQSLLLLARSCTTFSRGWKNLHRWLKCFPALKITSKILPICRTCAPIHDAGPPVLWNCFCKEGCNTNLLHCGPYSSLPYAGANCSYGVPWILISWIHFCCAFWSSSLFCKFLLFSEYLQGFLFLYIYTYILYLVIFEHFGMQKHFFIKNGWPNALSVITCRS